VVPVGGKNCDPPQKNCLLDQKNGNGEEKLSGLQSLRREAKPKGNDALAQKKMRALSKGKPSERRVRMQKPPRGRICRSPTR